MNKRRIMIVAGEASGDLHGAHLMRAMQQRHPALDFHAIGGPLMQAAGACILFQSSRLSVVGITEVLSKLNEIARGLRTARKFLKETPPDLLILIDFPDFNMHLAGVAKKYCIPVLYYISPQIWAWRQGRVQKMKKIVDHVAVILPFEEQFYREHHVPATFVGHPLLDHAVKKPFSMPPHHSFVPEAPVVGLLPGSREGEIRRHLPTMLTAARKIQAQRRDVRFIVPLAPSIDTRWVETCITPCRSILNIEVDPEGAVSMFGRCDLIVTASGTVTLEAAIAGVPMIIIYKVSPVSYRLAQTLIQVEAIGLVNLIAGRKVVPEFVQNEANPETIADSVALMLNDPERLENIRADLSQVRKKLGGSGASGRTAEIALQLLK